MFEHLHLFLIKSSLRVQKTQSHLKYESLFRKYPVKIEETVHFEISLIICGAPDFELLKELTVQKFALLSIKLMNGSNSIHENVSHFWRDISEFVSSSLRIILTSQIFGAPDFELLKALI
jgi:hypothetical protein